MPIKSLLQKIYNFDFANIKSEAEFREIFFARPLKLADLQQINDFMQGQEQAILHLKSSGKSAQKPQDKPFIILAQLHGNEPAGLSGIALAMALSEADLLKKSVLCVIGNPLAARQYFAAWEKSPNAPQETRDCYRCGLDENGNLLPDGNRIPVDFLTREEVTPHIIRSRELYQLALESSGILDIHSARGNMTCITEHIDNAHIKYSPIRAVLTDLSEAIAANASAVVSVQTLKTIVEKLPNIKCQTGIEAGRHEAEKSPQVAAEFTLATLYNLGITAVKPLLAADDGKFTRYSVRPRITYGDLVCDGELQEEDMIYMAREIDGKIVEYQYDEMEVIKVGQEVAIAKPSEVVFRAPSISSLRGVAEAIHNLEVGLPHSLTLARNDDRVKNFSGIFFSKSVTLYDKDPAVDPWPVSAKNLKKVKFCYPCLVSEINLF